MLLNKSIRLSKEDALILQLLVQKDARIENASQAIGFAIVDAAKNTPAEWASVAGFKVREEIELQSDYAVGSVKTFYIEDMDYKKVVESLKQQLGLVKVRNSYLVRLCIKAALMRLQDNNLNLQIEPKTLNGVELIKEINIKAAYLIMEGDLKPITEFLNSK